MADGTERTRKPRIRKTAPTVRQLAEAAQAKQEKQASGKKVHRPKVNLRLNLPKPASQKLSPAFAGVGKVLGWIAPMYFINSWREVRQVTWPSRRETWRLTLAVFVFALVFGVLVAGVDKSLDVLFKKLVLK